ncbi:MAG TPA: hypothetical protein VKA14_09055, partial [Gammaproteobacteria bacterium]|nr:hypothetical protein [Gammaproteobacteria bacterium]
MSVPPRTAAIRLLLGAVLCALAACAVAADFEDQVSDSLRYQLSGAAESWAGSALDWKDLRAFYGGRDYRPVWCQAGGLDSRGRALVRTLQRADTQGLDPQRYHLRAVVTQCRRRSAPERAWLELLLTDAYFRYCVDVRGGHQDPRETDADW